MALTMGHMWTTRQMEALDRPDECLSKTSGRGARRERLTLRQRLVKDVDCSNPDKCWLVTAQPAARYPKLWVVDGPLERHRVMFYLATGTLPEVVMHTCDTPRCINPRHLKAGTHVENAADMYAKARGRFKRGTCARGHDLSAGSEHLYVNPTTGKRQCRTCLTDRAQERRTQRRK